MRFKPLALSTLAVLAFQEATQQASATPAPDSATDSNFNVLDMESSVLLEIKPEVSVAPPELPTPDKGLAKATPQPLAAAAPAYATPERALPTFASSVNELAEIGSASSRPQPTETHRLVSQASVERDVYVLPVAATVTYGEPIPIAEGDPLNQFPVGSYHMTSDQSIRRDQQANPEQSSDDDEYVRDIRSCLAAHPDLFRIRDMDGELILVPILFNGQRGTIIGDAAGQPVCPSIRSPLADDNSGSIDIPVPAPENAPSS
jgi:hypothetical protein